MKNRKIKQIEKRFGAARNRFAAMTNLQLTKVNLRQLSNLELQQFTEVFERRFGKIDEPITPGFEVIDDATLDQLCAAMENGGGTVQTTEQQAEFIESLA